MKKNCLSVLLIGFMLFANISNCFGYNFDTQELSDPFYRDKDIIFGYNYNHTAIFSGVDFSNQLRIIEAVGYGGNVTENFRSDISNSPGNAFYGSYNLNNHTMDFSDRVSILSVAEDLKDADIGYPTWPIPIALDYNGSYFSGSVSDIDAIRCDGVVEYCYEVNGFDVWGAYGQHYDISSSTAWCDEHNNRPDLTVNADFELSPAAQRGAYGNTNTHMVWAATTDVPDCSSTQAQIGSTVYVNITANDQSGIHYIKYKIGSSGSWQSSPVQSRHPNSSSYSYEVAITESTWLYYYAKDNGGNYPSTVSPVWVEVAPPIPPVPTLSSPSDGSTASGTSVTFSWNASSGADNYHFQLATDAGFSNLLIDSDVGNITSIAPTGFSDNGTKFYWRVKAGNVSGWSGYSSEWYFYNGTISPPSLSSPSNGSTVNGTTIQFRWNESSGGDSYYLQVATDSSFNNTVYDDEVGYYIGIDIPGFPNDGTRYYWHVKAENSGRWSAYSSTWDFDNFPLVPPAPTLNLPSSGSNVSGTSVTFSWNASSGANNYHFQLATDAGFSNLSIDSDVGNTTEVNLSPFPDDGTTFYWRVKAGNVSGWSGYSSEWNFDNGTLSEYVISGYIRTAGGTAISGVTMTGWPGTEPVTDITGYYSGTVSSGWSGTIMPSKSNYDFSPLSRTYSNVTSDQTEQNYIGSLVSTEDFIEDFETGDFSSNPWYWFGDVPWNIVSEAYEGIYAARSGVISHDRHTGIGVTKTLPSGNITFWRKVSSENPNDLLIFYIDEQAIDIWSGEKDWKKKSYFIDEGTHTFDWVYRKNSSASEGNDSGWIDDIIFEPELIDPALYCWIDFHSYSKSEQNMAVIGSNNFGYNWTYEDSWLIGVPAGDFAITFESPIADDLELVVRHLSSAFAGCQGGGYSPVTISLNGTPIVFNYDPAENHNGSHGFVTDIWPISVNAGTNTLEWTTDSLCTHYWIQGVEIRFLTELKGDLDFNSTVELIDLLKLAKKWLKVCTTPNWCGGCDIDKTGFTEFGDFAIIAQNWLETISP